MSHTVWLRFDYNAKRRRLRKTFFLNKFRFETMSNRVITPTIPKFHESAFLRSEYLKTFCRLYRSGTILIYSMLSSLSHLDKTEVYDVNSAVTLTEIFINEFEFLTGLLELDLYKN